MKKKVQEEKEIKFYSKELKNKQTANDDYKKVVSFIITLVIVLLLLGLLFVFNGKYVTKDLNNTTTTTTAKVEYDDSLLTVDTMFNESGTYYVLVYDSKDKINGDYYKGLTTVELEDETKVYSVDLSLKMNSLYYDTSKEENIKEDNINFVKPTLIKISKGKIKSYTTDKKEIANILK